MKSLALCAAALMFPALLHAQGVATPIRFSAERESQLAAEGFRRSGDYDTSGVLVRKVKRPTTRKASDLRIDAILAQPARMMGSSSVAGAAASRRSPDPIPAVVPLSGTIPGSSSDKRYMSSGGRSGPAGARGSPGPIGPAGKDGRDGVVTEAQIAAIISQIVGQLKNSPELRGSDGAKGERGEQGLPGKQGPPGRNTVVDEAFIAEIIARLPPITVRTVKGGKVIDEEKVWLGGEPLNLNHSFSSHSGSAESSAGQK